MTRGSDAIEANQANDLLADLSHELRTSLTLMLGPLTELMSSDDPALEPYRDQLRTLKRGNQRITRLVTAALDLASADEGPGGSTFQPTDLAQFTLDLGRLFREATRHSGLEVQVHCDELPEATVVDRSAWEKIVLNLLSNALKYTNRGCIELSLKDAGTHFVLEVTDTGCGIAPEDLGHIFERFARGRRPTHRSAEANKIARQGTGIGLALTKRLVEIHGGTIRVESKLGFGSTFLVSMPYGVAHLPKDRILENADASVDDDLSLSTSRSTEDIEHWFPSTHPTLLNGPTSSFSSPSPILTEEISFNLRSLAQERRRVLIVEDHDDMRAYLARLLAPHYAIDLASDGEAALEFLGSDPPDLVVCDLVMPSFDGFALMEAIRGNPKTAPIPVIMISARASQGARIEGLDRGADDYVVKPFSPRELVAKIQSQLKLRRVRDDAERERAKVYRALYDAPVAIAYIEGRGHEVVFANAAYETLSATTDGRPFEAMQEALSHVYETSKPWSRREVPFQVQPTSPDESEVRFFNISLQPVFGSTSDIVAVLFFAFDVTDLARARQRLQELASDAELETKRKDSFLAMLSHELRNPLAPIVSAVELLHGIAPKSAPEVQWAAEVIGRQAQHLTSMVEDLLDVARLTTGRIALHKRLVPVEDIIRTALDTAESMAKMRGHLLRITGPHESMTLYGDPTRLAQVLANVLDNAAKYTPSGGDIHLDIERAGSEIVFKVSDSGRGIDPQFLPRIFDLFVQADHTLDRASGGLGLGLTLVKQLVEMHGGRVSASSDGLDRGSCFEIVIPLARRAASSPSPAPRPPEITGLRILIVDDNLDLADTLALLLRRRGHQVSTAADGDRALRQIEARSPDVVFVDIGLPGMNGYELARRLRTLDSGNALTLVALTGYGQAHDRRQAIEAGFDHHLLKPARIEAIQEILTARSSVGS
ncbi:MAG: response regulator [Deltaproteobacteria bacterium]|nr:response regulator [Deltaproteobacteria bacterium]